LADCNLLPKLNIVQVSAGSLLPCPAACPGFSLSPRSHPPRGVTATPCSFATPRIAPVPPSTLAP